MGATRDVALTDLGFRGISINDATNGSAAVTVVPSDSGVMFVNEYASATTYTLPAVADGKGKWFWFYNVGAGGIVVTALTACVVGLNNAAATTVTFSTTSEMIGAGCFMQCDGTNYFVTPFAGTAAYA